MQVERRKSGNITKGTWKRAENRSWEPVDNRLLIRPKNYAKLLSCALALSRVFLHSLQRLSLRPDPGIGCHSWLGKRWQSQLRFMLLFPWLAEAVILVAVLLVARLIWQMLLLDDLRP